LRSSEGVKLVAMSRSLTRCECRRWLPSSQTQETLSSCL